MAGPMITGRFTTRHVLPSEPAHPNEEEITAEPDDRVPLSPHGSGVPRLLRQQVFGASAAIRGNRYAPALRLHATGAAFPHPAVSVSPTVDRCAAAFRAWAFLAASGAKRVPLSHPAFAVPPWLACVS